MEPNKGKLYVIRKYFSSQILIWSRYLKIRLRLAQIYLQSSTRKHANDLDIFVGNGVYHFEEEVKMSYLGPRIGFNTADDRR